MRINIEVVPAKDMRYTTVGDWQFLNNGNTLIVTVAKSTPDSEFLVALHELIEAYLCNKDGITTQEVDAWDFEHEDDDEPGAMKGCPYKDQHEFAEAIERIVASQLGLAWDIHEENLRLLP
jgi:hypothetical protein